MDKTYISSDEIKHSICSFNYPSEIHSDRLLRKLKEVVRQEQLLRKYALGSHHTFDVGYSLPFPSQQILTRLSVNKYELFNSGHLEDDEIEGKVLDQTSCGQHTYIKVQFKHNGNSELLIFKF